MKEPKAMAYVNMYGVLACLENLCEIDDEAKAVVGRLKSPFHFALKLQTVRAVLSIFLKTAAQSAREAMAAHAR